MQCFVADTVQVAARAMKMGAETLKPYLTGAGIESKGTVVIGTVAGDLHDIGKNLVRMMMESKGFEVIDLGVDVPEQKFLDVARENNAKLVCCSALLTTTMEAMARTVELIKNSDIADKVKIMVGGAPVTQRFSDSIGADCYTVDAVSAAEAAVKLEGDEDQHRQHGEPRRIAQQRVEEHALAQQLSSRLR